MTGKLLMVIEIVSAATPVELYFKLVNIRKHCRLSQTYVAAIEFESQ